MSLAQPARVSALPGLRTFASPRFRLLVALLLAAVGLLANAAFLVVLGRSDVPWLEDFMAYHAAADRLLESGSPYTPAQLESPVDAVCRGCYLYPPLLAQALAPLTAVSLATAKVIWFAIISLAAFASVWLATGIRGARPSLERAAWCVVAVAFFYPLFENGWLGNVSSLVALAVVLVALGGVVAGIAAALSTLVKVSPAALLPVAFLADRRSRRALVISLAAVGLVSVALAPGAWLEYPAVLGNLLAGSGDVEYNLAPAHQAARLGAPDGVVAAIRAAAVLTGVAALLAGALMARRPSGLPTAAALATAAMLLIPGTLWYHYLAVLVPIAAMAWLWAGSGMRVMLVASFMLIDIGGPLDPALRLAGATALLSLATWTLWRGAASPSPTLVARSEGARA